MTNYTIIFLIAIFGWVPFAPVFAAIVVGMNRRLTIQEAEIRQLWNRITPLEIALTQVRSVENQNALDICRIGDMASDTCAEVTAQARVLDNHTDRIDNHSDRLSTLEGEQWATYTITYDQTDTGLIRATLHDGDRSFYGNADKTEDGALTLLAKRLRLYGAFNPRKFPTDLKSRYF